MSNEGEDKKNNIVNNENDYDDDFLEMGNLNINQEVDIKENPKKYIVDSKKQNNLKANNHSHNSKNCLESPNKKTKKVKSITYDDVYLGDDMFVTAPKSYPRDYEKNNRIIISFTKNASAKELLSIDSPRDSTDKIKSKILEKNFVDDDDENEEDDGGHIRSNTYDYYAQKGESRYLKDFLTSINNHRKHSFDDLTNQEDIEFVDEDVIVDGNIFFIENEAQLNNLNYYNKKNKCNISYITLNLFIKKLCTENLKEKYPILYKSFIDQYQELFPLPSLIEKIINAFNYYNNQMNIEVPDLVALLNKIISNQFKKIQDNEKLIKKLTTTYETLEELTWISDALKKEIANISYIVSSNSSQEFDLEYTRYLISDRRKTKAINIRAKNKRRMVNNKPVYKYPYFYIFDFSDEEIAKNLTLISYKMMSCIDVNELWNSNFSKEDKLSKAPNVTKLIDRFDKLMLFIIEDICSYETAKARAKLITKWANIAKKCKDLHNYNDLLIINQCFNHYLLKKLVSTWKKLSKSTVMLIAELNKFCSNQQCYVNIRRQIVGCKHVAHIPYLGILLKEIVDIEDKYNYIEKKGEYNCINCIKLQKIYMEVKKFFAFKNFSFTFTQINELNIFDQLNPRTEQEIEELIKENEKNKSNFLELLQAGNKKKRTKTDESFYC
jgi:hypothetical protein